MSEEKLVLACIKCSFQELHDAIRQINFSSDQSSAQHLPTELCIQVACFLTLYRRENSQVRAVAASSVSSFSTLDGCLIDDTDSWWLSGFGSMPSGMEFRLSEGSCLRRVHMAIPPLPVGPLSVREFRVDVADENGDRSPLPHEFLVDNRSGMQRFPVGDVDAPFDSYCLSLQPNIGVSSGDDHSQ